MAAPSNVSAGTALVVGALPYTHTQSVTDAGVCYTVWYQYTGTLGQLGIQVSAANATGTGTYIPDITYYAADGTTVILPPNTLTPIQVGTLVATDYYIKVSPSVADLSAASLRVEVHPTPTAPVVAGYVLINDDGQSGWNVQGHLPGVILNPTTGEVANIVFPLAQGDFGDILPNGRLALENFATDDLIFYAPNFDVVTTVDLTPATDFIRVRAQNTLGQFAVTVRQSSVTKFKVYSDTGTELLSRNTTLPSNPQSIVLSNDGGTMYYALQVGGAAIKTWNMTTNTAGADFAATTGGARISDMLMLDNGELLAMNVMVTPTVVKRYSAAGALLATYTIGTSLLPDGAVPRMAYDAAGGQAAFWVWWFPSDGVARMQKIQISDGTVLLTQDTPVYEEGVAQGDVAPGTFGASNSCPLIIIGQPIPSNPPTFFVSSSPTPSHHEEARYIRRLRRAPHMNNENKRVFYRTFELDLERGQALASGQGSEPVVLLRLSRDGGQTWGEEQRMAVGRLGEYQARVLARRLGHGRDLVFEVVVSDPVAWSLVGAWLDLEPGTS